VHWRGFIFGTVVQMWWRRACKHFNNVSTQEQHPFACIGIERFKDRRRIKSRQAI